ncbi:MAG: hypothetical protein SFW62_04050, partial [Alphaproteobacteria bacterium]|nr:hypothetical protein [Alphaproteobacteria bacterium]
TTITYAVKKEYEDLFKGAVTMIGNLEFADDKMRKIYENCLPTAFKTYEGEDSLILTVRKGSDYILMRDLMPAMPTDNLDRHVAWEMGRLHDMARYLDYAGIVHNDITPDTVFVSPKDHSVGLFGGWWYAVRTDEPLKAIPAAAEEFVSDDSLTSGQPDPRTDLEMIRACGRELLGDRGGTRLPMLKNAPAPMIDYLRQPSSGSAQKDLENWYQQVLPASFGARRFVKLPISYSDIYQPKGV